MTATVRSLSSYRTSRGLRSTSGEVALRQVDSFLSIKGCARTYSVGVHTSPGWLLVDGLVWLREKATEELPMISNSTLVDQVLVLDPRIKLHPLVRSRKLSQLASAVTRRWPLPTVIYSPQDFNSNGGYQSLTFPLHEAALSSSEIDPIHTGT